eukprot:TRINITY_DN4231_c0_g1_i2.p2 TRINITY_DN4231_c0_g1~~TRINITY_DN4231_c0_g1_i2.p2  ORF type:complete len:209 (-),score=12.60 TRINITY_DN4231_c0_g1_i2:610-1236(-)
MDAAHRFIAADWLLHVCCQLGFGLRTWCCSLSYLDKFCETTTIAEKELVRWSITALFIAAKVNETGPPGVKVYASVTEGLCKALDILQSELQMLDANSWYMAPCTAVDYVGWLHVDRLRLFEYFVALGMLHHEVISNFGSELLCDAATCMSLQAQDAEPRKMVIRSDVHRCMVLLANIHNNIIRMPGLELFVQGMPYDLSRKISVIKL